MYVLFLNLFYSAFSILQCICELQSFGNGSERIGLKATKLCLREKNTGRLGSFKGVCAKFSMVILEYSFVKLVIVLQGTEYFTIHYYFTFQY